MRHGKLHHLLHEVDDRGSQTLIAFTLALAIAIMVVALVVSIR